MAGNNFPTSEEDVLVPTYYLDIDGLTDFWAKAKQYINNQNLSLNGQNIPLYPRGTTPNISIADAIAKTVLKDHTHSVTYTPSGTVSSSFSGGSVSVNASTSTTTTVKSVKSVGSVPTRAEKTMPKSTHTHSVTYTPSGTVASTFSSGSVSVGASTSATTTVKSVKSVGSVPTRAEKTMPKSTHTHSVTYTPSGTVSSSFSGGSVSVNASTSATTTVKSVKSVGSVPTRAEKTMPKSSHTHSVTYTPSGTVSSSFSSGSVSVGASSGTVSVASSGHTHTIDTGDLSATFTGTSTTVDRTTTTGTTVASQDHTHSTDEKTLGVSYSNGVLTITSAHTHSVSATTTKGTTVASQGHSHVVTAAGTISITGDNVTTGAPSGTTTVASSGHTHTGTATGTVTSTFTGTEDTVTTEATPSTECETIYSITGLGSVPTTEDVTVASSGHTHTGTATGTVTSTFTGTQKTATASATPDTDCETIYSITGVGSVPTTEDVTVASSGHTHTGTATGTVTSTFTGTEDTVTTEVTPSTECETIYSITGLGSVPTVEDVTVASSGHTHTGTATGTVTSTFTGTEDTVTSGSAS